MRNIFTKTTLSRGHLIVILGVFWVIIVAGSMAWNWYQTDQIMTVLAESEVRSSFQKDIVYRRWAAMHGGVYVPITETTPPNVYLAHLPDRDIVTTDGKTLTLVNPAYMTRQVHELGMEQYGLRGNLTSLNLIRPENAPDAWETKALLAFETGVTEIISLEKMDSQPFLRLMRPLIVEESCLKCHSVQGYREGDIRGGLSVSVSFAPYQAAAARQHATSALIHLVVGTLGILGLWTVNVLIGKSQGELEMKTSDLLRTHEDLRTHQIELEMQNEELRAAQLELDSARERYFDLYDLAPVGYCTLSSEGLILEANLTAAKLLSVDRGALASQPISRFIYKEDQDIYYLHRKQLIEFGGRYECDLRLSKPDGSFFWAHLTATAAKSALANPDQKNDNETVHRVVLNDVTGRVQAEEERDRLMANIREQAKQQEQILASVPAGVLLLDAEGRILLANAMAEKDLAVFGGAQKGDSVIQVGDQPLVDLLTSSPTKDIWREVQADGRIFEVIARPVENGSEPEQWVLVIRDVTGERQIQAQLQQQTKLAALGQLAAGIAHDFNNILAVIVLYTQLGLKSPEISLKLRERLEIVSEQAVRAGELVQQILDFSRRAMMQRHLVDMAKFLKEIVKLLERTIPENVELHLSCGVDNYLVDADPTRIQQAIMNLVINSRDAMLSHKSGEIRIVLSRTSAADEIRCVSCGQVFEGEWVRISVTDNGEGIPLDVLPNIFDPFYTTKKVGKGSGLGLAQVYGIVKQHNGHIDVNTEQEHGTTFTIYLPALLAHSPDAPALGKQISASGHGETILVVEDNDALQGALADILEHLNYRVQRASNGREALELLDRRAGEISLVLSDLVMPVMGGQALFYAIRERGLIMPVVIISGHPMDTELENLMSQGLSGWLPKPPSEEQLAELLARALSGHPSPNPGDAR